MPSRRQQAKEGTLRLDRKRLTYPGSKRQAKWPKMCRTPSSDGHFHFNACHYLGASIYGKQLSRNCQPTDSDGGGNVFESVRSQDETAARRPFTPDSSRGRRRSFSSGCFSQTRRTAQHAGTACGHLRLDDNACSVAAVHAQ